MSHEKLDTNRNIHSLGIGYMYNFFDRVGFTIHEVIEDPGHHFQLIVKRKDKDFLVAVRTACFPDMGALDKATQEKLILESEQLNATPYFAGLAVTPLNTYETEVGGSAEGREYQVTFNGVSVVHKSELLAVNC